MIHNQAGGESGIRTHGTALGQYTRFRVERLQPDSAISPQCIIITFIEKSFKYFLNGKRKKFNITPGL